MSRLAITLVFLGLASVVRAAETHEFARYEVIVNREPFGAAGGANVPVAQPNFAARYSFVGTLKESEADPLLAIIYDKEGLRTYWKSKGETMSGIEIVQVQQSPSAKLILKQGLETATLGLEQKQSPGAAPPAGPQPNPVQLGIPGTENQPQPGVRRIPFRR